MHSPLSIGMILLIGGVAIAGIAAGFQLPIPQDDENAIAASANFSDPEIARLHEGCMTGHFRTDSYPDSLQRQYCHCYVQGASESLTSEQVRILAVTFENGPAGLEEEFAGISQSRAAELSAQMDDIDRIDRRCYARFYDAALALPSPENANSIRNNPRITALYDSCVVGNPTRDKSPLHVQRAYCECFGREAAKYLQTTDVRVLTAGLANGKAALEEQILNLPPAELPGLTRRLQQFQQSTPQKCLKAGFEAAGNG